MSTATKAVPRENLIADLVKINTILGNLGPVTRDKYRQYGAFSSRAWEKEFGTFKAFKQAAGLIDSQESGEKFNVETSEIAGDKWTITIPKTRISTEAELIEHAKIDLSIWHIDRLIVNSWEVGAKNDVNKIEVTGLFQIKAFLSKRLEVIAAKSEIESLKTEAEKYARIPEPIIVSSKTSGNMLEISLNDAHFGKLSWPRETGGPAYDTRIAQRLYLESVEHLLDRAKGYELDSILLILGNDLIHSDDLQGRTTKGTFVDCDTRYYKTFEVVRETVTKVIERLRKIAPVTVKMVSGNHDELSIWHLGDSLSALFLNYNDVTIDNEPTYRKYHQWGKCGLLLTHGDKGKRSDFPLLFATERPDIFGSTTWREVHTGHWHQTRTEEFHGVRVRIIPSLSAADSWHSQMGFVGQLRVGEAYLWNKEEGLIAQFYHNVDSF